MRLPSVPLWLELATAVFLALILTNGATYLFFSSGLEQRLTRFTMEMQGNRISGTIHLLLKAPGDLRPELAPALSSPGLDVRVEPEPVVTPAMKRDADIEARIRAALPRVQAMAHVLSDRERELLRPTAPREPPSSAPPRRPPHDMEPPNLFVSVPLPEGEWINLRFGSHPPPAPAWPMFYAGSTALAALLLAALFMGQRVARPLQVLAEAAGKLRRGEEHKAVPETGPSPVREAAQAFNAMSERVVTTMKSQQAMMAAIAHDLRTPLSVLRVRAEFVTDEETRNRLLETISEMQSMTESVLDAMRIDGSGEPARAVDIGVLVESLCADLEDLRMDVEFTGGPAVTVTCRIAEIRRALRNLVENAVRYGKSAKVSMAATESSLHIHVDDAGPGIPPDQLERVFEPFARIEESRNSETGGHGLGLAIARLIARAHGGEITLANKKEGGLRATLAIPLS